MGEGEEFGVGFYHGERRRRGAGRLGRGATAAQRPGRGDGDATGPWIVGPARQVEGE
jgi:hypothetical protein